MELSIRKSEVHMEIDNMDYQVSDYFPYIIKTVSEVTGRYVEVENSIELSIALEKFVLAQKYYDPEKGPFMPFIKKVIRNAIIDYMKSEKTKSTVPLTEEMKIHSKDSSVYDSAQLQIYEKELKKYGITFRKLADRAPVHRVTRSKLLLLAKKIAIDEEVLSHIRSKKRLPITYISRRYDITEKVAKTHKIYLMAVIIAYADSIEPVVNWIDEQG